jgi:hypothetical protein
MRAIAFLLAPALAACSARAGEVPAPEALQGPPAFEAFDHQGQARGPQDLLGSPHVLWFYPMAATPG